MNPLKVLTCLSWEISPQLWNPEQMKLNFLISVFKPCCHFSWRINWSNCSELSPSSRDCSLCFHYVKSSTRWRCCSSVLTCYCMYSMDSLFAWEHGKNQIVRMPVVHIKFLICKKTKTQKTKMKSHDGHFGVCDQLTEHTDFFSSCLESAWCSAQCPGANQSLDP